jgi:hypothetical protein
MAEKQVAFSEVEKQRIEAIVIDKDQAEALKYLAYLVECFKGKAGHACGTGPIK